MAWPRNWAKFAKVVAPSLSRLFTGNKLQKPSLACWTYLKQFVFSYVACSLMTSYLLARSRRLKVIRLTCYMKKHHDGTRVHWPISVRSCRFACQKYARQKAPNCSILVCNKKKSLLKLNFQWRAVQLWEESWVVWPKPGNMFKMGLLLDHFLKSRINDANNQINNPCSSHS